MESNIDRLSKFGLKSSSWVGGSRLESIRSSRNPSVSSDPPRVTSRTPFLLTSEEDDEPRPRIRKGAAARRFVENSCSEDKPDRMRRSSRIQEQGPRRKVMMSSSESEISSDSSSRPPKRRLKKMSQASSSESLISSDSLSSSSEEARRRKRKVAPAPVVRKRARKQISDSDSDISGGEISVYSEVEELEEEIVEKILGVCGKKYLVKFRGQSYRGCRWVSEDFFRDVSSDKRSWKLRNFVSKATPDMRIKTTADFAQLFDVAALVAEKIIGERSESGQFLVKWTSLNYADATWEFAEPELADSLGEAAEPVGWEKLIAVWRARHDPRRVDKEMHEVTKEARTRGWLVDEGLTAQQIFADSIVAVADEAADADPNRRMYLYGASGELKIFEFQREGVNWLLFNLSQARNVCLADSMGCGKTIQTAVFLAEVRRWLLMREGSSRDFMEPVFLVVSPMSTLENWKRELGKWTSMSVAVLQGTRRDRGVALKYDVQQDFAGGRVMSANVVVTSYETLSTEENFFKSVPWTVVVLDEAHRLKGVKSKMRSNVTEINCRYRLLLTGTPIQNSLSELWSLLNLADERNFPDLNMFLAEYNLTEGEGAENSIRLQEKIRPYLLQRKKEEVLSHLVPAKDEIIVSVELTRLQKLVYKGIYEKNLHLLMGGSGSGDRASSMSNMHMELRKVCNHPFLIISDQEELTGAMAEAAYEGQDRYVQLVKTSGKLVFLDKLIRRANEEKTKILIFSQFTMMLDVIEHWLRGVPGLCRNLERLDGAVRSLKERQLAIDRFNNLQGDSAVFLLSTKAGGVGLNLASASQVVLLDHDWNAQNDLQAIARAHRIGSQSRVTVFRLVSKNSYEEVILKRAGQKLGLEMALMGGRSGVTTPEEEAGGAKSGRSMASAAKQREELEMLLKEGVFAAISDSAADDEAKFMAEDLDSILKSRATHVVEGEGAAAGPAAGGSSSLFSRAVFKVEEGVPELSDPDFWKKIKNVGNMKEAEAAGEVLPLVRKTRVGRKKVEESESEMDAISDSSEGGEEDEKVVAMTLRTKSLVKFAANLGLWKSEEEISEWRTKAAKHINENWSKRAPKQRDAAMSGTFDLAFDISVFIAGVIRGMKVARTKDDVAQTLAMREAEVSAVVKKAASYLKIGNFNESLTNYMGRLEIRSPEFSGLQISDHILNAITTAEFAKLKAVIDGLEFFDEIGNLTKFPTFKKTTKNHPDVWTEDDDKKLIEAVFISGKDAVGTVVGDKTVPKQFPLSRLNQLVRKSSTARAKVLEVSVLNHGFPETLFEQVLKATGYPWSRKFVQPEILSAQLESVPIDIVKKFPTLPKDAVAVSDDKTYWKNKFPGVGDIDEFARLYLETLIDALGWKGESQKTAVKKLLKTSSEKFDIEVSRENAFRAMWRLQAVHFARRYAVEADLFVPPTVAPVSEAETLHALTYVAGRGFESLTSEQVAAFVKVVSLINKEVKDEGKRLMEATEEPEKKTEAPKPKKQKTIIEALASMKPLD